MVASGDWLVPRLNGIMHLAKPPLAYWASGAGMRLLGVNETGARMGEALAAAFLFWAAAYIAGRATERARLLAPIVLASSVLVFALARLLASDVFLAASVAGFYVAWLATGRARSIGMFVALGLGFLAKGPVVFAHTLLPLFVAALWRRERTVLAGLGRPLGWILFAAIGFPWYLVVIAKTPGLLGWLLGTELWARYTTTVHHRAGPPWYFVAVLAAGALPWTAAAIHGTWRAGRSAREPSAANAALVSWAIAPVFFFSASGSKLPAYVLPELAALAILAARALARPGGLARWGTAVLLAALAIAIETAGPRALAPFVGVTHSASVALPLGAHVAAAAFTAGAIAIAFRFPAAAALAALTACYGLLGAARTIEGPIGSPIAIARILERARQPDEPVVELGAFSAALPFYLGRPIAMVDVPRTGAFEAPGSETHAFLDLEDLPGLVRRQGRVWIYAPRGRAAREAEAMNLRYEVIARTPHRELVLFEPMPPDTAGLRSVGGR
ncbi:MAG: glycosyltransferase family 39 protein [Bacteroidota bacterium]